MSLPRCTSCGAFVVETSCPSCGSARTRATKIGALATLVGSSVFAMTLMACYGAPAERREPLTPDNETNKPEPGTPDTASPPSAGDAGTGSH